jgi:antitoxin (DNA-binding transcriptional repressor) of toxin-antitoxin stability system
VRREIALGQLRQKSDEILRGLERGEWYVVTQNGVPLGELAPRRRRRFVDADAALAVFGRAPSVDHIQFRADVDRMASQAIRPRT